MGLISIWITSAAFFIPSAQADEWNKVTEEPGFVLFSRELPNSSLIAVKGEGTISAPVHKVASILLDHSRGAEWIDGLREYRVPKSVSPTEFLEYSKFKGPFFVSDRDFLSVSTLEVDPVKKQLVIRSQAIKDPVVPEDSHYVRGDIVYTMFELTPLDEGKHTKLVAEIAVDPKGWIPKWIVNAIQKYWPKRTFMSIRKQAAKEDIGTPKSFESLLEPLKGTP